MMGLVPAQVRRASVALRAAAKAPTLLLAASIACGCATLRSPSADRSPEEVIAGYVERRGLPSVVAAVMREGRVVYETAQGVRKLGDPTPVSVRDAYHIGSDTRR